MILAIAVGGSWLLYAWRLWSLRFVIILTCGFGILGLALGLRRVVFKRTILLRDNDMLFPTGFMQHKVVLVPYAEISELRQYQLPQTHVITFRCGEVKHQLVSTLMPDDETYVEVCNFLALRTGRVD